MPSFSVSNFSSAPYTPEAMTEHTRTSSNYHAPYSTVAYTDLISLSGSSMGFLPNHAYHNTMRFNAYGQSEADGFGYETHHNFLLGRIQLTRSSHGRAVC
jgi:hypothetical protein